VVFHSGEQADELDAEDPEGYGIPVGKGVCGQQDVFEVVEGWIGNVIIPDEPGVSEPFGTLFSFGP